MVSLLHRWYNYLNGKNWHYIFSFSVTLFLVALIYVFFDFSILARFVAFLAFAFPFWGPLVMGIIWWYSWKRYVKSRWISKQKHTLLEVRIPNDLHKTPKAMEVVFNGLNVRSGMTTFITRNWYGGVGFEWAFEIHSYEGTIRFYMRVQTALKEYAETQIYSQYPEVEIAEVPDYASGLRYVPSMEGGVYGVEHILTGGDGFPIKTYVDYELEELDVDKYEEKISDPLGSVFERLSSVEKGEQVMLQIIFRQTRTPELVSKWFWLRNGSRKWKDDIKKEIKKIYANAKLEYENIVTGDVEAGFAQLKPGEMTQVKALQRSIDKLGFEVGIRVMHLGTKDGYRGHINSPYFSQLWRQFSSGKYNTLAGTARYWHQSLDYFWQDILGWREWHMDRNLLDAYRRRRIFDPPYDHFHSIMSSEELASIFHFPGADCDVPGIARIPSRKSDAPVNLPT